MAQDRGIEALAIQAKVHIALGYADLIDKLLGLSQEHTIFQPPRAESIAEEVAAIIPGVQRLRPAVVNQGHQARKLEVMLMIYWPKDRAVFVDVL